MFDGFFVVANGIQKVLQQRYGYEGDFVHDWGQSAPTDVIAPNQDAVTEKYRERYRQIYAVFVGGEQALSRMREQALSRITRVDAAVP